jgi:hypothetical protein
VPRPVSSFPLHCIFIPARPKIATFLQCRRTVATTCIAFPALRTLKPPPLFNAEPPHPPPQCKPPDSNPATPTKKTGRSRSLPKLS